MVGQFVGVLKQYKARIRAAAAIIDPIAAAAGSVGKRARAAAGALEAVADGSDREELFRAVHRAHQAGDAVEETGPVLAGSVRNLSEYVAHI